MGSVLFFTMILFIACELVNDFRHPRPRRKKPLSAYQRRVRGEKL